MTPSPLLEYVHPTYKSCVSDLHSHDTLCASDLQNLCIRPMCATGTSILMVTLSTMSDYICSSCVSWINKIECTSDLQLS